MKCVIVTYRRAFLLVGLCLFSLFLNACSVQMPGSKLDSTHTDSNMVPGGNNPTQRLAREQMPLKVNYLTPLSAIKDPKIFVYKGKRRLYVIDSNVLARDYPIGLGSQPRGDKEREGDGRTPEGEFLISVKNPEGKFVRSLGLSYPDKKHAEKAFFTGAITPSEFKDILLAYEKRSAPPLTTSLGGQILIHAGGAHGDWTDGCIALYDSDMEELFKIAAVGTPVTVRP
ncbi:MAG: murein L,D-transpeptidase family protein [Syntrophobacteraceae bacterium]